MPKSEKYFGVVKSHATRVNSEVTKFNIGGFIEDQSSIHVMAGDVSVLRALSSDGDITHPGEVE